MLNLLKQKKYLKIVNQIRQRDIRNFYYHKPISLFNKYYPEVRFPKVIRKIFLELYSGKITRAIVTGPRGGGKTLLLSALGFCLWLLKRRKLVDMGGAFAQAKILYNYILGYLTANKTIEETLERPPRMQYTVDKDGNYMRCIPASQKQVRGPHPDVLFIDETCEGKDEIIEAALPMVDTSDNSLIVMTSTFHKIFGVFQEYWDNAKDKGYKRYTWDIFDVAKPFDRKIFDDERLNREIPDLKKLKKLSKGKLGDPEGWIPIGNIIQAWREKPTLDYFLVEYMGKRPSRTGLVSAPEDVDACEFDDSKETCYNYIDGAFCTLGIDWGFSSMTSVVDFMAWKDQIKVMLENKNYTQVASDIIIEDIVEICIERPRRFVYADSEGKFENVALQKALNKAYKEGKLKEKTIVKEVVFSTEKEECLGCYRSHFEKRLLRIPKRFKEAMWQYKRFRYKKDSNKVIKKDDHIPDATLCALTPFKKQVSSGGLSQSKKKTTTETKPITAGIYHERF